jgi:hypothetical protein
MSHNDDDRSVRIGGNAAGNQIVTGDGNSATMRDVQVDLPPAESVDAAAEVAALRELLLALGGVEAGKVGRALDDAAEEVAKDAPDRAEAASALDRALSQARKAGDFADQAARIVPRVRALAGWLGEQAGPVVAWLRDLSSG